MIMDYILRSLFISAPILLGLIIIAIIGLTKLKDKKIRSGYLLVGSFFGVLCVLLRILFNPLINAASDVDWIFENIRWVSAGYFFAVNFFMAACLGLFAMAALKPPENELPPEIKCK